MSLASSFNPQEDAVPLIVAVQHAKAAVATAPPLDDTRVTATKTIQRAWRRHHWQKVARNRSQLTCGCSEKGLVNNRWSEALALGKVLADGANAPGAHVMLNRHWIEAADPLHRYGTRLAPYYKAWLESESKDGFFKWLDRGDGKDLDLATEGHPRAKLQASSVHYLTKAERRGYQVDVRQGRFFWSESGSKVNAGPSCACALDLRHRLIGLPMKYIFVMDLEGRLYIGKKKKGLFHHSSFLGARPVRVAGSITVRGGVLLAINSSSGHYRCSDSQFDDALMMLEEKCGLARGSYVKCYASTKTCPAVVRSKCLLLGDRWCCCRRRDRGKKVHPAA